jgi:gamma-glutamyltranspeptidase
MNDFGNPGRPTYNDLPYDIQVLSTFVPGKKPLSLMVPTMVFRRPKEILIVLMEEKGRNVCPW